MKITIKCKIYDTIIKIKLKYILNLQNLYMNKIPDKKYIYIYIIIPIEASFLFTCSCTVVLLDTVFLKLYYLSCSYFKTCGHLFAYIYLHLVRAVYV